VGPRIGSRSTYRSRLRRRPLSRRECGARAGEAWTSGQTVRKSYWYPALDLLAIPRRNLYQTRHTFASRLLSEGANPLYVAQQMGHKDWGMIRTVYGKWIKPTSK
jgi:integrase